MCSKLLMWIGGHMRAYGYTHGGCFISRPFVKLVWLGDLSIFQIKELSSDHTALEHEFETYRTVQKPFSSPTLLPSQSYCVVTIV